jgi:hypothetical protein
MLKRTISLVYLILFLTAGNLLSQKVFRDGYIVKKTGETLNGLVEYSVKQGAPSECRFKRFDIANEVVYSANDIKAFGYRNGNRYESKEFNSRTSFYEVLAAGKIFLYARGSEFFVEKDNSGLTSLKKVPVSFISGEQKNEYKTAAELLRFLTEGKTTVPEKLDMKNDLVPLIAEYNRNAGEGSKVYNRTMSASAVEKIALASGEHRNIFGVMTGVAGYMLNMEKLNVDYVPAPAKEFCPVFGLSYERILSRKSGKLSFSIEILGFRQTFYTYSEWKDFHGTIRSDAFYDFTAVKAPVMFRYSPLTGKKFVPYISAGIAFQYLLDHNFRNIEEIENNSHEISTYEYENFTFNPREITALAGIGVKTRLYNNIFLNLQGRVEYGGGLFKDPSVTSEPMFKQNSIQPFILLGVTF